MKPKVLHLLDDRSVGGITSTTTCQSNSRLSHEFEFKLVRSSDILPVLKAEKPDIVIFHNPSAWGRLLNLSLVKLYAKKIVIHEHHYSASFERWNVSDLARFRLMLKTAYHLVDQVVAVSEAQESWMQSHRLVSPHKLTAIQQCRMLDDFFQVSSKTIRQPLVLGAYGRFCSQKGFDILLQAMQLISNTDIHLHIGGYGEDEALLRQLAQGQKNVKFWGPVRDVPAFLSACDVVVIPSRWEPWGNVCLEAKAAGKPVIASNVDGLNEQVKGCGILLSSNSPEQLAEAICSIAALPPQALESWGKQGRELVKNSWENYLNSWDLLLKKTLDS